LRRSDTDASTSHSRGGIVLGGILVAWPVVLADRQAACTAPMNARAGSGRLATVGDACADTATAI